MLIKLQSRSAVHLSLDSLADMIVTVPDARARLFAPFVKLHPIINLVFIINLPVNNQDSFVEPKHPVPELKAAAKAAKQDRRRLA